MQKKQKMGARNAIMKGYSYLLSNPVVPDTVDQQPSLVFPLPIENPHFFCPFQSIAQTSAVNECKTSNIYRKDPG